MLTLYQFDISPFCDKVRRAMVLKGLEWRTVEVPITRPNKYKGVSPTGKFPALDDDGRVIVDSSDILRHLEVIAPAPSLYPDDPRDAALAHVLEDWADESLYFFDLTMRNWPHNRPLFLADLLRHASGPLVPVLRAAIPGVLRRTARAQGLARKPDAVVAGELARHYDALETMLDGRDWLVGDAISVADLSVRAMGFVLDRTAEGTVLRAARPALDAWSARVDARTLGKS